MFTKGLKKLKGKNPQQPTIDSKEYLEMIGNDSKDPTEGHEETTTLPEPIQSSQLLSDLYSKNEEFRAFVNTVLTKNDQQRERARASEKKLKQQYQAVMAVETSLLNQRYCPSHHGNIPFLFLFLVLVLILAERLYRSMSKPSPKLSYASVTSMGTTTAIRWQKRCLAASTYSWRARRTCLTDRRSGGPERCMEGLMKSLQEMYDQILQAEAIILSEDRAGARAEEPVSDKVANKPKEGAARAEGAAAQEREEVIRSVCKKHAEEAEKGGAKQDIKEPSSELQEKLEAQDEELYILEATLYVFYTIVGTDLRVISWKDPRGEHVAEKKSLPDSKPVSRANARSEELSPESSKVAPSIHDGFVSTVYSDVRWKVEKKALLSLIMDHLSIEDDSEGSDDPSSRFQDSAERQNLYAKLKEILNENGTNKSLDSPRDSAHVSSRPLSAKVLLAPAIEFLGSGLPSPLFWSPFILMPRPSKLPLVVFLLPDLSARRQFVLHESPGAAPGAERSVPHKPKTPGDIDETMCMRFAACLLSSSWRRSQARGPSSMLPPLSRIRSMNEICTPRLPGLTGWALGHCPNRLCLT
eukprot:747117-Hanusia_phi.AAC.14